MKESKIENNKIYSNNGLCERTDIFEIVDKIPVSFFCLEHRRKYGK